MIVLILLEMTFLQPTSQAGIFIMSAISRKARFADGRLQAGDDTEKRTFKRDQHRGNEALTGICTTLWRFASLGNTGILLATQMRELHVCHDPHNDQVQHSHGKLRCVDVGLQIDPFAAKNNV